VKAKRRHSCAAIDGEKEPAGHSDRRERDRRNPTLEGQAIPTVGKIIPFPQRWR
jgi:hypothetical protein